MNPKVFRPPYFFKEVNMKSLMRLFLKKDIKSLLPGFAMFVTAGVALLIVMFIPIMTGNGNLATTTLNMIYLVAWAAVYLYIPIKGANLYRKNLRDENYVTDMFSTGCTGTKFLLAKMLWSMIQMILVYAEYMLIYKFTGFLAAKRIEGIKDGLFAEKILNAELAEAAGIAETASAGLEVICVLVMLCTMFYFAFGLSDSFFMSGKFSTYACFTVSFCIYWGVTKIINLVVSDEMANGFAVRSLIMIILAGLFVVLNLRLVVRKRLKKFEQEG